MLAVGIGCQMGAEGIEGDRGEVEFVFEQAFAEVGDDEVGFVPIDEELVEQADGVGCARGAGDADDEAFARWAGRIGRRG